MVTSSSVSKGGGVYVLQRGEATFYDAFVPQNYRRTRKHFWGSTRDGFDPKSSAPLKCTTHASTLEKAQVFCLRIISGASNSTPHVVLQNEACASSLASRRTRRQHCILSFVKIMSLPDSHVLRKTLRYWWLRDVIFEVVELFPPTGTFFGLAF